jgi:beta-lactamase class C
MMRRRNPQIAAMVFCLSTLLPMQSRADTDPSSVGKIVAQAITPLMARYGVPGMAVGVVLDGQNYVFDYGVASKATSRPVTHDTLFEIGSVSKTFTATLASYAQVSGDLSFSDMTSKYLPALRGSAFDKVSLTNLGTHTPGGLPLEAPDDVTNDVQVMEYFRHWKPDYPPGTYRTYSNLSAGLLGLSAARSMNGDFTGLMARLVFSGLGLKHTYLNVPTDQMENYAQGYTRAGAPIRVAPGPLATEAYGIRMTAGDLLRFVDANMGLLDIDGTLQRAISNTHTGYYHIQTGGMIQDLIWEQYPYPVRLQDLLAGNSSKVSAAPNAVAALQPPLPPQEDVLIDKTGSTNGFASYVAFVPEEKLGIVVLANRNIPVAVRVKIAYDILTRLHAGAPNN